MAHSSPFRFAALVSLGAALLLSGCCANDACDCNDADADAIRFRFVTDTTATGKFFRPADLDTILLERSPLPYDPRTPVETAVLYRRAGERDSALVLDNNAPFAQKANTKLNAYRYVLRYLTHPPVKGTPTPVVVVDRVELSGALDGNGCCTCYTNTRKAVYTNGGPTARELRPGDVIELTKP